MVRRCGGSLYWTQCTNTVALAPGACPASCSWQVGVCKMGVELLINMTIGPAAIRRVTVGKLEHLNCGWFATILEKLLAGF